MITNVAIQPHTRPVRRKFSDWYGFLYSFQTLSGGLLCALIDQKPVLTDDATAYRSNLSWRERISGKWFSELVEEYLRVMAHRWTNEKTRWQWHQTLKNFANPPHRRAVAEIETTDIVNLLQPIWLESPEKAAKARMRLEAVLDYAKSKGHHPAMPYQDVPTFVQRLASLAFRAGSPNAYD